MSSKPTSPPGTPRSYLGGTGSAKPEADVDLDWGGKLWLNGQQVLGHASIKEPTPESLMVTARGTTWGYWLDPVGIEATRSEPISGLWIAAA